MPLIKPLSKKLAKLHQTDSILNKFVYTSGMDANDIGKMVHKSLTDCNNDYWILEGDYTGYDAH